MRNQEAARYARWAATAAGLIVLVVIGVYTRKAIRDAHLRGKQPAAVPITVQQQSAQFAFSKVEQDRTIFTIRASQATQFKDQNRAVLEDVWITIYGRAGDRTDNIHTRECSYEPKTGEVRCAGDVQIDIGGAAQAAANAPGQEVEVKTSDLSFNRESGEATTSQPVEFTFPQGRGRAVGVDYSSKDSIVRLQHAVELNLEPSDRTGGLPVDAQGSSLEIRRNDRMVTLQGPAVVKQGSRELTADSIAIELDPQFHARTITASGHPRITSSSAKTKMSASADEFQALLSPEGWVDKILAVREVAGMRQSAAGTDHFSADQVEFQMHPRQNWMEQMTASGNVILNSRDSSATRSLKTSALRVAFAPPAANHAGGDLAGQQRLESAQTLGAASIEMKSGAETTDLSAGKFVAQAGRSGRFEKLVGQSGVQVTRQSGTSQPQTTTAANLTATFGSGGDWNTLEETGNVQFQQGDRQATAAHARIVRSTGVITLDGAPALMDAESRTTASGVFIDQKTGALQATGGVVTSYVGSSQGASMNFGSGTAHISADSLTGSTSTGHVIYSRHARLWQGDSVLDADRIEIWREDKKVQASGNVVAVFPQMGGLVPALDAPKATKAPPGGSAGSKDSGIPTLWHIRAPLLTFYEDSGMAHLEGGVMAGSDQGTLASRTLDVFFGPPPAVSAAPAGPSQAAGGRELTRALASGNVVVTQGGRRGTAQRAEYTATDGKFVLSGGNPAINDADGNTTTGHSLTFFVASDTILIDSQQGSRTLTKHRVQK